MTERLTHVIRNQREEIWVSLQEVAGEKLVELRVYERTSSATGGASAPTREVITLPVSLLPILIQALSQAQDTLVSRGLVFIPPSPKITQSAQGEISTFGAVGQPRTQPARAHPRVALNVPGECRQLDTKDFWPSKPIVCEVKDVSMGGAQISLLRALPRFVQLEVTMVVDGMLFRARAEVVAVDARGKADPTTGHFRHSLRWVTLEGQARVVLEKVVESRLKGHTGPSQGSHS